MQNCCYALFRGGGMAMFQWSNMLIFPRCEHCGTWIEFKIMFIISWAVHKRISHSKRKGRVQGVHKILYIFFLKIL